MEYPKLNEELEQRRSEIETEIESARGKMDKVLETLGEQEAAVGERRKEYEDFQNSKQSKVKPKLGESKKAKLENAERRVRSKNGLIESLRTKIEKLEQEDESLERSTEELKTFNPVAEQANDPALLRDFEFSPNAHLKSNGVFRIFEGRFTPLEYRVMPKADGKYATKPWSQIPIDHCVVDPRLVPEWMIREFELAEWTDPKTELETLKLANGAIPRLRELFGHVKPLGMRMENGQWSPNYRFMGIQGFSTESDGKILYSRYRGEEAEEVDTKMVQVHESAYSALRMTGHARHGYKEEVDLLTSSELQIESLQRQLSQLRKGDPDFDERKEEVAGLLAMEAKKLEKSTNYHKKASFRKMLGKLDLKDGKGRENLGATCAVWLAAIRLLKERKPQISEKSRYGDENRQTIELLISESENLLGQHFGEWASIGGKLGRMGNAAVFNGSPEEKLGSQKEYLARALFARISSFNRLEKIAPVRPFLQYSQLAMAQEKKVRDAIEARDLGAAIAETKKVVALSSVFRTQKGVEDIIGDLSLNPMPDLGALEKKANQIIEAIRVDPAFETGTPISTLKNLVLSTFGDFKGDLEKARGVDPEALPESLMEMKERLKSLDFVFWLGSLG